MPDPRTLIGGGAAAVHLLAFDHPGLPNALRNQLIAERNKLITDVGEGLAQDWADYKHRVGVIAGLKTAIELCGEIEKKLGDG